MNFKTIKTIFIISVLTIFFSLVIFFVKNFYFQIENTENTLIEEKYIEPISLESPKESLYEKILKNIEDKDLLYKKEIKNVEVNYSFLPNSFKLNQKAQVYKNSLDTFFQAKFINEKLKFLNVYFYKNKGEVRGRMKNKKLHLFGILFIPKKEFVAVSIHEFGHFLDLYILEKKVSKDISQFFYDISWKSTLVLKKGQSQKDFVSGYSMTNKYEDFAESFTYYVLHNGDFLQKSKKSIFLKKKYDFFNSYIFRNNEFVDFLDGKKDKIRNYYRDITKIDYNLENFEKYLQK